MNEHIQIGKRAAQVLLAVALAATTQFAWAKNKGPDQGKSEQWYLQTIVVVENGNEVFYDDRSGVIGRIEGAVDGYDQHDVPTYQSANGATAAIVFQRSGDGWPAGQYLSDYRAPGTEDAYWDFTVFSNRSQADVTLLWKGVHLITNQDGAYVSTLDRDNKLLNSLKLVDLQTGEVVKAYHRGELGTLTFNMAGQTARYFRWVQGDVNAVSSQAAESERFEVNAARHSGTEIEPPSRPLPPGTLEVSPRGRSE